MTNPTPSQVKAFVTARRAAAAPFLKTTADGTRVLLFETEDEAIDFLIENSARNIPLLVRNVGSFDHFIKAHGEIV